MAFLFNPRPVRWLALAGMLAVLGVTLSSYFQRTRERAHPRPSPPRIAPQINQQTQAFSLSKTLGDHTLYTVEASEVTHFKNKVVLRGVSILLYGKQGERRDRIESQECEYDPATGSLSIPGQVTMQLGIPAAEPGQAKGEGQGGRRADGTGVTAPSQSRLGLDRGSDSKPPLLRGRGSDSNGPVAYAPGSDSRGADTVTVVTTGLAFDQNSGIASTDQLVRFLFAQGQGTAKGAVYNPQTEQLTLRSAVELVLSEPGPAGPEPQLSEPQRHSAAKPQPKITAEDAEIAGKVLRKEQGSTVLSNSGAAPDDDKGLTHVRAASLRFQRDESTIYLGGPVELTRDARRLQAGDSQILLDVQRNARRVRLEGGVVGGEQREGRTLRVQARRGLLDLTEQGKLQALQLEEEVAWAFSAAESQREGRAQQLELFFTEPAGTEPAGTEPAGVLRRIVASRDVQIVLRDPSVSSTPSTGSAPLGSARDRPTTGQRLGFRGPVLGAGTQTLTAQQVEMTMAPDGQTLRRVATPSRSTLELVPSSPDEERWRIVGQGFEMGFDPAGNLSQFAAEGDVRVVAESPRRPARQRVSTSDRLAATLDPRARSVARIEQWGHYRYQDSEKQARSERAEYFAEQERTVLQNEAAVWNSTGKLAADKIVLHNATGNLQAEGKLSTTYLPTPSPGAQRSDPIHVVAERMSYDAAGETAQYEGHVRLWQGMNLLEAGWVEFDRREKQLEARDRIYTVFPQPPAKSPTERQGNSSANSARSAPAGKTGNTEKTEPAEPTEIRADRLLYKQDERRAIYHGGVRMRHASASLTSGELELFFESARAGAPAADSRRIERAVASHDVLILDPGRKATAERAEYHPAEEIIHLFGKPAAVHDPLRGDTQGVRLTYRMGDDRILVEGEPGLPAETRRQVQR